MADVGAAGGTGVVCVGAVAGLGEGERGLGWGFGIRGALGGMAKVMGDRC